MTSIPLPEHVKVLVVGSGFAGLGMAIKLQENGQTDFLVVEKGGDVGGTWRVNDYPGAACDVPSQLYSFSFAPNKHWKHSFSHQPEIQAYMQRTAQEAGVLDRFCFDTSLDEAVWDDSAQVWRITTSAGDITADVLVSGAGGLSEPKLPEIDGIESFEGEIFHSARWNHDYDLTGKRVAVIGTGASAIQIIPQIAETVGHLDVYQRTAPWVMPRHDREYPKVEKAALRFVPGLQKLYRSTIFWGRESYVPAFTWKPAIAAPVQKVAQANINKAISDPDLRAKVTPDFRIGCKRILISNTYYPALAQANVEVVTDPIDRVTPTGIVTADGTEHPIDALIVATGFQITDQPIARHITGRDDRTLSAAWKETGMVAYKGTTIDGFPNFFQIVGPNTGLGHTSMVVIIEAQIAYIIGALQTMDERRIAVLEPLRDKVREWSAEMQRRMQPTVWHTGGCASWYLDEHGNNTTLWPRATFTFRRLLAQFDLDAYATTPAASTTTKENAA